MESDKPQDFNNQRRADDYSILLGIGIPSQTSTNDDDVKASERSCRILKMTIDARERMRSSGDVPENDKFTAAAKACKGLEKALSGSDQGAIRKATQTLRPMFALLMYLLPLLRSTWPPWKRKPLG